MFGTHQSHQMRNTTPIRPKKPPSMPPTMGAMTTFEVEWCDMFWLAEELVVNIGMSTETGENEVV